MIEDWEETLRYVKRWKKNGQRHVPPGVTWDELKEQLYKVIVDCCMMKKLAGELPVAHWYEIRGLAYRRALVVDYGWVTAEYPLIAMRHVLMHEDRIFSTHGQTSMNFAPTSIRGELDRFKAQQI